MAVKNEVRKRCLICGGTGRTYGNGTVESATDCWKCCGSGYYPLLEETQGQVTEAAIGDSPESLPCHVCGALGALAEVATEDKFVWACCTCAGTIAASLKAETEVAVCPACHGKGKDGATTCFYCEGSGKEPVDIPVKSLKPFVDPLKHDLALPLTERNRTELVDSAQARIRGIYELDREIVSTLGCLDGVRAEMKKQAAQLVRQGVPGKNEKEREAALLELLQEEQDYPGLMEEEQRLDGELKELRLTHDYMRRMHHLELALIQGEAVTP